MTKEALITNVSVEEGLVLIDGYSPNRVNVTYTGIPLLNKFTGIMKVPEEGQRAIISETNTGTEYVEGILSPMGKSESPPSLNEGEFVLQFDPDTRIIAEENGSGNYDITVKASGDVTIGESSKAVEVAVQAHTHTFTKADGSTGTTTGPNESGTSTTVE
jgi:hypothetical protein